jgi:hypothetical protein
MAIVGFCRECGRTVYVETGDQPLCPVCLSPVEDIQVDESRAERLGRNEALARELNEGISKGIPGEMGQDMVVLCECGRKDCSATIPIDVSVYEQVRTHSTQFILATGHEIEGIEQTLIHHDSYVIVEKVGEAAEVAEERDPR